MKKISKTSILRELKYFWNTTKEIHGVKIRRQAWVDFSWQVVDSLDFDNGNILK